MGHKVGSMGMREHRWASIVGLLASVAVTLLSRVGMAEEKSDESTHAEAPRAVTPPQQPAQAVTQGRTKVQLKADDQTSFYLGDEERSLFVCTGGCSVALLPGKYKMSLRRGIGDLVQTNPLEVTEQPETVYGLYEPGHKGGGTAVAVVGVSLGGITGLAGMQQVFGGGRSEVGVGLLIGGGAIATIGLVVGALLRTSDQAELHTGQFEF